MESTAAVAPTHTSSLREFSLNILTTVRSCQQQNGLGRAGHSDYNRYRQFVTRKLERLRRGVELSYRAGRGFKYHAIKPEEVKDVRHLMIYLFYTERAWAYAMALKDEDDGGEEHSRAKFHSWRRMAKAEKWARDFAALCQARGDARTKIEAEAYLDMMIGTHAFQREQWTDAFTALSKSKTILSDLHGTAEEQKVWRTTAAELENNIRYCKHVLSRADGSGGASGGGGGSGGELEALLESEAQNSALLKAKLAELVLQSRKEKAQSLTEVVWHGQTIPVRVERLRVTVLAAQSARLDLDRSLSLGVSSSVASSASSSSSSSSSLSTAAGAAGGAGSLEASTSEASTSTTGGGAAGAGPGETPLTEFDRRMALYDALYSSAEEALVATKDEVARLKSAPTTTASQKDKQSLDDLHFLQSYLSEMQLRASMERTEAMVADGIRRLESQEEKGRKAIKADDIVHLHDTLLQIVRDVAGLLEESEDDEVKRSLAAKEQILKSQRCFWKGRSFLVASKWSEAALLFGHVSSHLVVARERIQACRNVDRDMILLCDRLGEEAAAFGVATRAEAVLSTLPEEARDELEWSAEAAGAPPALDLISCKPVFFDLAGNEMSLPDISHRFGSAGGVGGSGSAGSGSGSAPTSASAGGAGGGHHVGTPQETNPSGGQQGGWFSSWW